MSEQNLKRADTSSAPGSSREGDSELRLVTSDGAVVFPDGLPPSDDTPTIISKGIPTSDAVKPAQGNFSSLRGRKLAHFELMEPIGVGGMAAVLRARDTQLDRYVALKVLPPDMASDPENIRRFHQEARAAAKLDHENIARVFYCGEDQQLHFIAFEFVEGENLRTLLDRRGRLPVAEAVRYVLQIATGLEHAASRGVVHRDVKPSNIIISPNGRAKLVDMGLARSVEPHHDDGVTQSGVTLGTFDYISPEQAIEPRDADSRSDLYSLGCTFYHMLTGQASVPEGTAAKKLHHHQHVPPIDPRQLNPEIPDELAAILGRMMAKDPKDRYQRPVHLVQHLMQIAQQVGAAADVPEGVLFVDVPLPGAPRTHPLLMMAGGTLALGVLLLILSLAPSPGGNNSEPAVAKSDKRIVPKEPGSGAKPGQNASAAGQFVAKTEQDLARALADPHASIQIIVRNNMDLAAGSLVFKGDSERQLVIESADPWEPRTIRFKHQKADDGQGLEAGLILDGGTVIFRNLIFEIEGNETPKNAIASLGIKGNGVVKIQRCTFLQKDVPARPLRHDRALVPVACVVVDNALGSDLERPRLYFDQCFFQGGQVAVGIHGPAEITATDCAFKPYNALFHVRDPNADNAAPLAAAPVALKLFRCSAFVVNGPAFRLDGDVSCRLQVEHSIFSCPENIGFGTFDLPHLIHQTDAAQPAVVYEGLRNCYHNLNALWVWPTAPRVAGKKESVSPDRIVTALDEFRIEVVKAMGRGDIASTQLGPSNSPWASADPLKQEPKLAFRLKSDMREVRTQDLKRGLGVDSCVWGKMDSLPALMPAEERPQIALKPHEKLVDPDADDRTPGVFKTVFQALASVKAGDVLLIKEGKTRLVEVHPIRMDKPGVDVTLKPYPGEAPILVVPQTSEKDAAMFRVHDAKIQFEGLEFVLEADQPLFEAQSVVLIGANASCSFKNCVITMQPAEKVKHLKTVPLSAVTLIDPEDAMKMAPRAGRAAAEIRFEDCYLRGEGHAVTVRASRPLDLDVKNSLIAVSGSLLVVTGAAKEVAPEALAQIKLWRVSAFVTEPLIVLRAGKNAKGLAPTRIDTARDCLFAALGQRPLVYLESEEANEDALRGYVDWKGEHNAYAHFDRLLETQRPEDTLSSVRMDSARWADFFKEPQSKFGQPMFQLSQAMQRTLWLAQPEQFLPRAQFKDEFQSFGSTVSADTLPKQLPAKKLELETSE